MKNNISTAKILTSAALTFFTNESLSLCIPLKIKLTTKQSVENGVHPFKTCGTDVAS